MLKKHTGIEKVLDSANNIARVTRTYYNTETGEIWVDGFASENDIAPYKDAAIICLGDLTRIIFNLKKWNVSDEKIIKRINHFLNRIDNVSDEKELNLYGLIECASAILSNDKRFR